jgi:hypothetical protein
MKVVCCRLMKNDKAKIEFPSENKMTEYALMAHHREPLLTNVIGFVDGVAMPVKCSSLPEVQSTYYNGYYHDTMINNVFAFAPTGKVIFACINYPGSWHDSQVAASLIDVVIRKCIDYAMCVDQGFPRSGMLLDKFVGPISARTLAKISPIVKADC